jgi:hypothetical protein
MQPFSIKDIAFFITYDLNCMENLNQFSYYQMMTNFT